MLSLERLLIRNGMWWYVDRLFCLNTSHAPYNPHDVYPFLANHVVQKHQIHVIHQRHLASQTHSTNHGLDGQKVTIDSGPRIGTCALWVGSNERDGELQMSSDELRPVFQARKI